MEALHICFQLMAHAIVFCNPSHVYQANSVFLCRDKIFHSQISAKVSEQGKKKASKPFKVD